jgi:RNA polymerase sigma-70 factor (sigma-E family)
MDVAVVGEQAGVDAGFDAWVASRSGALTRFAYLVTGNQHEAEEALQAALTSACAKWSRVRRADDPEAYVRRMVVNAHISWWRSFRRRETPTDDVREERSSGDPADSTTEADRVWRLCATLPPRQRAAVVLRFYEDLSFRQIADVLDCTEATARSHIHRAMAALRKTIEKESGDE